MEKGTNEMDPGAVESLVRAVPSPQSRIGGIGVVDPGKINGPFIHLFTCGEASRSISDAFLPTLTLLLLDNS